MQLNIQSKSIMTSLRMLTYMKIVEVWLCVRPMIEMVVVMFMMLVFDVLMKMMAKMEGG